MPQLKMRRRRNGAVQKLRNAVGKRDTDPDAPPRGVPRASFPIDRATFNTSYSGQYFKVARTFQFSGPSADSASFKMVDPAVTCSTTLLQYATGGIAFAIDSVPNVTEFGALFDQYRIDAIQMDFEYITSTQSNANTGANQNQTCNLAVWSDYDDATAPTASNSGWQAALETGRAKIMRFPGGASKLRYTLVPRALAIDANYSDITGGRAIQNPSWIDGATGNPVLFYGLKYMIQANPAPTTYIHTFRLKTTWYMSWRNRQ